jgi:hypothetical protein
VYALLKGLAYDLIATYDAETGNAQKLVFKSRAASPSDLRGMALSGTNLYVANSREGIIAKINATTGVGNAAFIPSIYGRGPESPYALAVNANLNWLYVTNNSQNSNGDFYISTYTADTGALIKLNFIPIATSGLYGLALQGNTLYVSVFGGSAAPGVYTYDATTGLPLNPPNVPFVSVNEPWGIAIGSPPPNGQNPTLYVASQQEPAMIYEFDATTGYPTGSIKLSAAPTNITVEPAN